MLETLLAQDVKQALDFPAQERGIELGGGSGFHLRGRFIQARPRAADGESLLVKKLADAPDQQYFMVLVITPIAAPFHRLELGEFLLPVA